MSIDAQAVRHVALLSRIELTDEELEMFTKQLGDIVAYIDQLEEVDTKDVAPMEHTTHEGENVLRDDEPGRSLDPAKALGQAPEKSADQFRVPKVVERHQ